jgi:hypothetical protein
MPCVGAPTEYGAAPLMRQIKTAEARAAALFIDRLPDETRAYLLDMIYRVAGVDPPPPPSERERPHNENVIRLSDVAPLARCS